MQTTSPNDPADRSALAGYWQIARVDHWFKNVFMLPGIVFALYDSPGLAGMEMLWRTLLALLVVGLVTSSNYVLNEILDAPFDALHPVKRHRPVPSGTVDTRIAWVQWLVLGIAGAGLALPLGTQFTAVAALLWVMGLVYNVPPLRFKDTPWLDVLTESVNNPLRLLAGWYAVGMVVIPPASLMAAYWMIGAFFMAVKRLAEFRRIGDPELAARYRSGFAHYNEERLLVSVVYYGVAFGLFFGIFIMRYRLELLLAIPFIAGLVGYYIHLGFMKDSPAQYPERLFRHRAFVGLAAACVVIMLVLLVVDVPLLVHIFVPTLRTS